MPIGGGGGGNQSAGFQIGQFWSPGGLPANYFWTYNVWANSSQGYVPVKTTAGANVQVPVGKTMYFTLIQTGPYPTFNDIGGIYYADDLVGTNSVTLFPGVQLPGSGVQVTAPSGKFILVNINSNQSGSSYLYLAAFSM